MIEVMVIWTNLTVTTARVDFPHQCPAAAARIVRARGESPLMRRCDEIGSYGERVPFAIEW